MRILLAGATGALGRRLVPRLVEAGHNVVGSTRSSDRFGQLRALGAEPVAMDGLDTDSVRRAVDQAKPDVLIHQLTALTGAGNLRRFDQEFALTNRLRTETTVALLAAAADSGASRFIVQSYTGWPNERTGGPVKTEDDPLDPDPPRQARQTLAAIRRCEELTLAARPGIDGVVLRYGAFYGPGTGLSAEGDLVQLMRQRKLPLVGSGDGIWSFCHIDDAADATVLAVTQGEPASTTSSTTTRPRCTTGSRLWRRRPALHRHDTSPPGWHGR
jgi:nucleoside-diphosphate-sugar epimerase